MSLRRRLLLVFAVYLGIIGAGGAFVLWITTERNEEITEQRALIPTSALDRSELAALMATQRRLEDLRTRLTITIFTTLGAALVTTLAAAVLVRRWITRPLDQVGRAIRGARVGEIGLIAPHGPPEIADLARDADAIRGRMNRALYDATRARETIDQTTSVLFTLRAELETELEELPSDWTVAAELRPAEGVVAGDCYDLIRVSPSELGVVIVDISGHGAVSGILALRCKELLRAGLRNGLEPGPAVQWAADQLDDLGDETFLSAFVALVEFDTGYLRYANAGHPPPLLVRRSSVTELQPTGPIVGPFFGPWITADADVSIGSALTVYTDGLVEVRSDRREEFGTGRLARLVQRHAGDHAEMIVKRCLEEIDAFAASRLRDDATIVLLCRNPNGGRSAPIQPARSSRRLRLRSRPE